MWLSDNRQGPIKTKQMSCKEMGKIKASRKGSREAGFELDLRDKTFRNKKKYSRKEKYRKDLSELE